MKQKIGFGTGLPNGGWTYMATQDPAPRIPFTHGMINSPDTMPRLQKWEKISWSFAIGFWLTVIAYYGLS